MSQTQPVTADSPTPTTIRKHAGTVALWVGQALLAIQFAPAGILKVTSDPMMVEMFAAIGAGQWLRYAVGVLEIAAALGLLVPRLCGAAALGVAALMIGATLTNIFLLAAPPWMPIGLLVVSALIAWARRTQIKSLL
ncbi:DoxX family protein [Nonomuraea sp. LPB2021202275-12-8]|uniref:DoxX family protein n=1 Tax=Nonomuraea sp. LPB2021202275-12-8 TaxID=3120159 RepID=UPI00300C062D